MGVDKFTNEQLLERLRDSLDGLHREMRAVDIWAGALSAFMQPVPDYKIPADFLLPPKRQH